MYIYIGFPAVAPCTQRDIPATRAHSLRYAQTLANANLPASTRATCAHLPCETARERHVPCVASSQVKVLCT
jgi:hypothetical protein